MTQPPATQPDADETTRRDPKNAEQGLRCDVCGAYFTTEALLGDHKQMHDAKSGAEREALQDQQGERKP